MKVMTVNLAEWIVDNYCLVIITVGGLNVKARIAFSYAGNNVVDLKSMSTGRNLQKANLATSIEQTLIDKMEDACVKIIPTAIDV